MKILMPIIFMLYGVMTYLTEPSLFAQTYSDQLFIEVFEKIGKQKDWEIIEIPQEIGYNDSTGLELELRDHFIRFDAQNIYKSVCRYQKDSSLYEIKIIPSPYTKNHPLL